jgi:AraC-like DNA-binding protein
LNKICKNLLGQTAGSLIHRQVILEAQRLLSYTTNTINEIANELGFDHPSYFVTVFKKTTNQTPEQYRKSQQE